MANIVKSDRARVADMPQMMKDTVRKYHRVQGGKGSSRRKCYITPDKFRNNWDSIKWSSKNKGEK